ncbi:MAG: hypothetical protein H0V17_18525, partial [Deltaproteobacteria bacterium]|nr:hypothetical protein [Deltaproteobacteria bacterium]
MTSSPRMFPFEQLAKVGRDELAIHGAIARQLAARSRGARFELAGGRLEKLVSGPVRVTSIRRAAPAFDPNAVHAELRFGSHAIAVAASGAIRVITQRLLGGPDEIAAPRPPTAAEHAIWALLLAAAVADARIAADVWPLSEAARTIHERALMTLQREIAEREERIGRGGMIVEE